jgi:hypothetical protein
MRDFFEALKETFPRLAHHPRLMGAGLLSLFIFIAIFKTKKHWSTVFLSWANELCIHDSVKGRWVFIDRKCSGLSNDWKYYTSHTTGFGETGDDLIWTLVSWPSLKPLKPIMRNSFRMQGAIGMASTNSESRAKLMGRWGINHDPYSTIGFIPAPGVVGGLRRLSVSLLLTAVSISRGVTPPDERN